jgi:hypothetical protein
VLFNRVLEPEIDLLRMRLGDRLTLSDPGDMRQPTLWIAILSGRTKASPAAKRRSRRLHSSKLFADPRGLQIIVRDRDARGFASRCHCASSEPVKM